MRSLAKNWNFNSISDIPSNFHFIYPQASPGYKTIIPSSLSSECCCRNCWYFCWNGRFPGWPQDSSFSKDISAYWKPLQFSASTNSTIISVSPSLPSITIAPWIELFPPVEVGGGGGYKSRSQGFFFTALSFIRGSHEKPTKSYYWYILPQNWNWLMHVLLGI